MDIKGVLVCLSLALMLSSCKEESTGTDKAGKNEFDKALNVQEGCYSFNKALPTEDQGYLLIGGVGTGEAGQDCYNSWKEDFLVKIDKNGDQVWATKYAGCFSWSGLTEGAETSDHGFVIYKHSSFESCNMPYFLDVSGTGVIRSKTVINSSFYGLYLEQLNDTDYLLLGENKYSGHAALQKVSTNGTISWMKEYGPFARPTDIVRLIGGNYIISRGFYSAPGDYLTQVDSEGNVMWSKQYQAYKLTSTSDGGFVAVAGGKLVKFDSSGNLLWSKDYSDMDAGSGDGALYLAELSLGYMVLAYCTRAVFSTPGTFNVLLLNSDGDPLYKDTKECSSQSKYAITKTKDNGLFIAINDVSYGQPNVRIIKYSSLLDKK